MRSLQHRMRNNSTTAYEKKKRNCWPNNCHGNHTSVIISPSRFRYSWNLEFTWIGFWTATGWSDVNSLLANGFFANITAKQTILCVQQHGMANNQQLSTVGQTVWFYLGSGNYTPVDTNHIINFQIELFIFDISAQKDILPTTEKSEAKTKNTR